jgi:hypothetical protein
MKANLSFSNRVAGRTSRPARFQFATDSDQSTVYDRQRRCSIN